MEKESIQKASERINNLIFKIQELAYQKDIKTHEILNIRVELKNIGFELLKNVKSAKIRDAIESMNDQFYDLCAKPVEKSDRKSSIKTKNIQKDLDSIADFLREYKEIIKKFEKKRVQNAFPDDLQRPEIIDQKGNAKNIKGQYFDEAGFLIPIIKKNSKYVMPPQQMTLEAKNLELFPTKGNPNPKHEELLHELGAQKACYVNYWGEYGNGSGFICSQDEGNLYVMTNKHVAFKLNEETGKIEGVNYISGDYKKNLEFEENSGIKLIRTRNIQYFPSNNIDMAILKIPKQDLEIRKKPYIPQFSPDLMKNGEFVVSIGNSHSGGTVSAFGNVKSSNYKIRDDTSKNKINTFINSKLTIYPGNSGGPLFSCNVTEKNKREVNFSDFSIVGLNARSVHLKKEDYQAKRISDYTEYDKKFDELRRRYFSKEMQIAINDGRITNRSEQDAFHINLMNKFHRLSHREQDRLIGFDEEKYAPLKYEFAEISSFSISSKDLINEIDVMKWEYPELENLKLKVAPSRKSEVSSISEQSYVAQETRF